MRSKAVISHALGDDNLNVSGKMNTKKPTEAFLTIARAIAPKTEGNVLILPGGRREFGEKCAADVLTALSAVGYVIVPRAPTKAMLSSTESVHISFAMCVSGRPMAEDWISAETAANLYTAMISAAEKGT